MDDEKLTDEQIRRVIAEYEAGKTTSQEVVETKPDLAENAERNVKVASSTLAFILGVLLGPVGLFYAGNYAAGFAWLVMTIIFVFTVPPLVLVCWIGMAIHAAASVK